MDNYHFSNILVVHSSYIPSSGNGWSTHTFKEAMAKVNDVLYSDSIVKMMSLTPSYITGQYIQLCMLDTNDMCTRPLSKGHTYYYADTVTIIRMCYMIVQDGTITLY